MSDPIPDSEYLARESIKHIFTPEINNFVAHLDDPSEYWCTVVDYAFSFTYLTIDVSRSGRPTFRMGFRTMYYYEGPMRWKGAHFAVGSYEEGMELLGLVGNHWGAPAEAYQEAYQNMGCLYKVSRGDTLITRILAWSVDIGDVSRLE